MKLIPCLMVVALLVRAATAGQGDDTRAASSTNSMSVATVVSNVTQTVRDIHGNVVVGEKTEDRISTRLRRQLLTQQVSDVDHTNLVVFVYCGDPIYHIAIQVGDGVITNLAVGLTPICLSDSER